MALWLVPTAAPIIPANNLVYYGLHLCVCMGNLSACALCCSLKCVLLGTVFGGSSEDI